VQAKQITVRTCNRIIWLNTSSRNVVFDISDVQNCGPFIRSMYPATFEMTVQSVVASVYMLIMSAQSDAWNADICYF
jgi:hypothetical protein